MTPDPMGVVLLSYPLNVYKVGDSEVTGLMTAISYVKANSENCVPLQRNKSDIEKVKGQGHGMVQMKRACHKDHACQISMLYHEYFRRYEPC